MNYQDDKLAEVEVAHEERVATIQRQYKQSFWGIIFVFGLFTILTMTSGWVANQLPNLPPPIMVEVTDQRVLGPDVLCPGDTLTYQFRMAGAGSGVLDLDGSTWHQGTPLASFGGTTRVVITGPFDKIITDSWIVPPLAHNLAGAGPQPWQPGQYQRNIAVSTTSRSSSPTIRTVNFSIGENCNE
jgi:hypothetical protein